MKRVASALLALLIAAHGHASANVLVVAAGGGGTHVQIQAAVDAATDGDTLLVKSGIYDAFVIADKELNVIADTGASVRVDGTITVRNLSADRTVVLAGLNATGAKRPDEIGDGLLLENNLGSIRVQDSTLIAKDGPPAGGCPPHHGAIVDHCEDVAFVRCTIQGRKAHDTVRSNSNLRVPSYGMLAASSHIALYDCSLRGGDGWLRFKCTNGYLGPDGGNGGTALYGSNCAVFASNSAFQGGRGGNGLHGGGWSTDGGNGGYGVQIFATLLDCPCAGGEAGHAMQGGLCASCGQNGSPGQPFALSSVTLLSGSSRVLTAPNPVRELSSIPVDILGQAGDVASIYISRATRHEFEAALKGVHMTGRRAALLDVGTLPSNGHLHSQLPPLSLDSGVESANFYIQLLIRDTRGNLILGSPASLIVLDQAF